MSQFVVSLIGGVALGSTLALISLGLVLVFRSSHTFNFAHGEMMLVAPLVVGRWQANVVGPFWLSALVGLVCTAVLGVGLYLLVLRRMVGLPPFLSVIATLGFAAVVDGLIAIYFGNADYVIDVAFLPDGYVTIGGARFTSELLLLTAITLGIALLAAAVLKFTHIGVLVRAAGQDALLASQGGINIRRLNVGVWIAASVMAGLAGLIYGVQNVVTPSLAGLALIALPAMMLGGLDSVNGAIVGGLCVGLLQGFVATYLGGEYTEVATYSLLLVVLLFLPNGLFGTKAVTRV